MAMITGTDLKLGLGSSQLSQGGVQLGLGLSQGGPFGGHTEGNSVVLIHGPRPHADTGAGLGHLHSSTLLCC